MSHLSAGEKLGPYEILSQIGEGGMGEVYRARDTALKRDVALKVLPSNFSNDADRAARFQREAEVLASLDHPNIAPIFGMIDAGGVRALVLALIEGPTLADRIAAGSMPVEEAVAASRQMVEALEYAHERGVIHRDLKPANIKITADGVVKVLDFGLAKVLEEEPPPSSLANSPTLTMGHTRAGVILGTAAYMSPEQAVGRTADRRSDIFSFGAVLFEMLTGKQAFAGATTPDVLEAVVKNDPEWRALPPATPEYLRNLLRRTLVKDRKRRLQAIGEARIALEHPPAEIASQGVAEFRKPIGFVWPTVAGVLTIATLGLGYVSYRRGAEDPQRVIRFAVPPPPQTAFRDFDNIPAVSPDGKRIAIEVRQDIQSTLRIRDLDALTFRILPGSEGGRNPFWSPDSKTVAFFADGKLKRIDVMGGSPFTICECNGIGASWSGTGTILFGSASGLYRVPAAGGSPAPFALRTGGMAGRWPWFLPDGRHFLFSVPRDVNVRGNLYAGDLESGESKHLLDAGSNAIFANGYLLYLRENSLMAQPFDPGKLQATGDAAPIAEEVGANAVVGSGFFSASATGVLAYGSGGSATHLQLTWFDRSGKRLGAVGPASPFNDWVRLSPDDSHAAVTISSGSGNDIWLFGLARGDQSRFTFGPSSNTAAVWSPDGKHIAFASPRDGLLHVFQRALDRGTDELVNRALGDPPALTLPEDWSPDGRYLVERRVVPPDSLWIQSLFGDRKAYPFAAEAYNQRSARVSPDGKWLAYASDESGPFEVYVQSFPAGGGKVQVSIKGGERPAWSRDGKELYFMNPDSIVMAAAVHAGEKFEAGEPKALFDTNSSGTLSFNNGFDVSKDGRFLIPVRAEGAGATPLTVVVNWAAGLKK